MATKSKSKSSSRRTSSASSKAHPHKSNGKHHGSSASHSHKRTARPSGGKSSARASSRSKQAGVTDKLTKAVKQHPVASAVVGAGTGLLLIEGLRRAFSSGDNSQRQGKNRKDLDLEDEQSESQGSQEDQSDADDESEQDEADEDDEDDESRPQTRHQENQEDDEDEDSSASAESQETHSLNYPLMICVAAMGLGLVSGLLLPATSLEDQTMGKASERLTKRITSAGKAIKKVASKAYDQVASATVNEAERMGITPDRLARKVKRLAVKVRDSVSDAVQG